MQWIGKFLVGHVQIFRNKTATVLRYESLVVYPVLTVQLDFTYSFWKRLNENDHTVVRYLSMKVP